MINLDPSITATLQWSLDLTHWHSSGATAQGTTVQFTTLSQQSIANEPEVEWVHAQAAISAPPARGVFFRVSLTSNP